MKQKLLSYHILIFLAAVYLFACSKTNQVEDQIPEQVNIDSLLRRETTDTVPSSSSIANIDCPNGPKYKDSLIYIESKSKNDYIVTPINDPGPGKYYSWPQGMVLDSLTGSINVTASETGLRYMIGFVKNGTKDTCLQTIILAGVSYVDSIYVLGKNQTLAHPYFNSNLQTSSICVIGPGDDDDADDDGNDKCEFSTANKRVKVRSISGIIDLEKVLENETFGPNPVNGRAIKASIYYKLNDKSNKAPQKMDVQLVYYQTKSQIPQAVVDYVQQKRSDIMMEALISIKGNPRPPMIIITRS